MMSQITAERPNGASTTADASTLSALETCQRIIEQQIPNLLRVYLNPWVTQSCLCLNQYAQRLLRPGAAVDEPCPSFLTNSCDEALSGAIKLARYTIQSEQEADPHRRGGDTLIVDPDNRFPHFGTSQLSNGRRVEFLPGICRSNVTNLSALLQDRQRFRIVVLAGSVELLTEQSLLQELWNDPHVLTISVVDTRSLDKWSRDPDGQRAHVAVFDESFVDDAVPFAAFVARRHIYQVWMEGRMSMFHSTTFQPNTLSSMHFMRCLQKRDPELVVQLQELLEQATGEAEFRHRVYHNLYSPSLSRLIRAIGFDQAEPQAAGHIISFKNRRVFDGVAGVACSLRGHNPESFVRDCQYLLESEEDLTAAVSTELRHLTALSHFVPAVSGAAAVEHALQLAMSAQPDRQVVLVLKGGFGGKTLGALTGTWKDSYRTNIGPLYQHVVYVDPFAEDACARIDQVLSLNPVGIVQLELIQGVGGVRCIPQPVLDHLQDRREEHGYLLFVDEVQTGMFRTGPFLRSLDVGVAADLVSIGKGTSDTMFPFAATLYGQAVHDQLQAVGSELPAWLRQRYGCDIGYAALLNTLRRAEADDWTSRVRHQESRFRSQLVTGLKNCRNVLDVRVFGMLMGIELRRPAADVQSPGAPFNEFPARPAGLTLIDRTVHRAVGDRLPRLYSLAMLQHPAAPLLIGFCQYEPHVFKLTPGLLMTDQQIDSVCQTVCETLNRSVLRVSAQGVRHLARTYLSRGRRA
ncbi:MAG: aminotransferase class III-fold pyridoxal phosphate-dependent enzyme [Fuerstiella sp.]